TYGAIRTELGLAGTIGLERQANPMRTAVTLTVQGHRLVGTAHQPALGRAAARIGVLFLSPGAGLRCGQANFASIAGDALAAAGFTVLRFDFPGLGDSPGPVAAHTERYHLTVQRGALAGLALGLVAEARRRYGLDAIVIGGL